MQSALIVFNNWASQEIRLFRGASNVEVEWTVGPIPIEDSVGKEIIIRYDTDIDSASQYYTDANGREILQRIRDYRPTWNYSVVETVSGNYYLINSRIWIRLTSLHEHLYDEVRDYADIYPLIFALPSIRDLEVTRHASFILTPFLLPMAEQCTTRIGTLSIGHA